jgi:lipopolysaccharide export system permease protein
MQGLTLFITDTSRAGEMAGIFLDDQRDPAQPVTYSAERALLLREGMEARLVMLDGVALSPGAEGRELNSVLFDQFVFDLSELLRAEGARVPRPSEYPVRNLLAPTAEMLDQGRYERADFIAEAHYKLTLPLLAMLYPMIALVTLLAGGYRRSGFGRRVIVAIGLAVLIQVALFGIRPQVQAHAALWPLMYLPLLLGYAYVAALLARLTVEQRPAGLPA